MTKKNPYLKAAIQAEKERQKAILNPPKTEEQRKADNIQRSAKSAQRRGIDKATKRKLKDKDKPDLWEKW